MQQISPEQAEHLSPEMQSLYAFKDYEDKFHEQFTEIKNGGSLNYVQNEMPQVQNLVASNNPANNTPQELEYKQNGQQVTSPSMA